VQRQRGTSNPPACRDDFVLPGFRARPDGSRWLPDDWDTVPRHRNPAYNERLQELLDLERGDDVVQVGWISARELVKAFFAAGLMRKG